MDDDEVRIWHGIRCASLVMCVHAFMMNVGRGGRPTRSKCQCIDGILDVVGRQ